MSLTRIRRTTLLVATASLALALLGCAGDDGDADLGTDPVPDDGDGTDEREQTDDADGAPSDEDGVAGGDEEGQPERLEPDPPGGAGGGADADAPLDAEVGAATGDLAERTEASADEITVVTEERVTWPDGSLGCPEDDQMYTMALVDGYRIVLELDGQEYTYHGEDGGQPFLCEDPSPPADTRDQPTS